MFGPCFAIKYFVSVILMGKRDLVALLELFS